MGPRSTDLGACPVPDGRRVLVKQNYPKLELKLQLPTHMPEWDWLQGRAGYSKRDLWSSPEDVRVGLDQLLLGVQHHLWSWRESRDVKDSVSLLACSLASLLPVSQLSHLWTWRGNMTKWWHNTHSLRAFSVRVPSTTYVIWTGSVPKAAANTFSP